MYPLVSHLSDARSRMADVLVLVLDPGIWSEWKKLLEGSKINESLCSPRISSYVEIDVSALLLFIFTSFPLLGFLLSVSLRF